MTRPTDPTRTPLIAGLKSREDRKAALATAKAKIDAINAREAERLRLAGMKRVRQSKLQAKGMAT